MRPKHYLLVIFGLLGLTPSAWCQTTDGRTWNGLTHERKLWYVEGYADAAGFICVETTHSVEEFSKLYPHFYPWLGPDGTDSGFTDGQLLAEVDRFYGRADNLPIRVPSVIQSYRSQNHWRASR